MTPEEMEAHRARVAAQKAKVAGLEDDVARIAARQSGPVMLACVRVLVEMVCAQHGDVFRDHYKEKFYSAVIALLRQRGIS